MYSTTSRHGGVDADERRASRRRVLLDAALDVIGEDGVSSLRVRKLAARAGLNDRYFYESFADCDELAVALLDDQAQELVGVVVTAISTRPDDLAGRVRVGVDAILAFVSDDPRRSRLLIESQATDGLRARRSTSIDTFAALLLAQAEELVGGPVAPTTYGATAIRIVANGIVDLVSDWLRGTVPLTREELADHMVQALLGLAATL